MTYDQWSERVASGEDRAAERRALRLQELRYEAEAEQRGDERPRFESVTRRDSRDARQNGNDRVD